MRSRFLALGAGLFLVGCVGSDGAEAQDPASPESLLREGSYAEALPLLEDRLARQGTPQAAAQLATILFEIGRFDEVEALLRREIERSRGDVELRLILGRTLLKRGRLDEADQELGAIAGTRGGAPLLALVHQGEILLRRGEREAALQVFDRFIDVYNGRSDLDSRELQAVAQAVRHMGVIDPALYQDALRAYDEAVAADPDNLEAHVGTGTLFLSRLDAPEARSSFQEVLARRGRHPHALLGLAEAAEFEGSDEAGPMLDTALEVNSNLVPALVLRASRSLAEENGDAAEADLEAALQVNPSSAEALAVLAGMYLIRGMTDEYERTRDRALAVNPRDAQFFVTVAELASNVRFYAEAEALAGRGAALDSLAWDAYGVQGLNQLRLGEIAAGRRNLEIAFEGDPYNVWFKNTLDLLDVMDTFEEFSSPSLNVYVEPEDGEALAIYMTEVGERALEDLSARYRYRPETPIRVEAFRRSADFSVRTMGLAGIGALGVAFGRVVAMDSPSARGPQGFDWASTLWHELTHVVHMGMTEHRVPRWLTEGLAVHEERRAGVSWGMRPSLAFFAAYIEDRVRPPSQLSQSFVRPRSPEEVGHAYVLGSIVAGWIEETRGFDAILDMLEGYRDGRGPEDVMRRALGIDLEELDRSFDVWFRERYADPIRAAEAALELRAIPPQERAGDREGLESRVAESPLDVESRIALARVLISEEEFAAAIGPLTEARDLFPENPDPAGPNRLLARVYTELGNDALAMAALAEHVTRVGGDYAAHLQLAELLEEAGRQAEAAETLEEAIAVYPFEISLHDRLARLYRELGNPEGEVRERRVALALDLPDRAGALHLLAEAQLRAGRIEEARASVLQALELAPLFPEAQDLLLTILSGGGDAGGTDGRETDGQ